jgi:hypothetical protein
MAPTGSYDLPDLLQELGQNSVAQWIMLAPVIAATVWTSYEYSKLTWKALVPCCMTSLLFELNLQFILPLMQQASKPEKAACLRL